MKKAVWVVKIGDYNPKMCALTIPNLMAYADKIGADFHLITERRYPDYGVAIERLQIHELGRGYEWNILIDADMLIHPNFSDATSFVPKDTVWSLMSFPLKILFQVDRHFARDSRRIAISPNFLVISDLTHDIWIPFDLPIPDYMLSPVKKHFLDDFIVSHNLARFGIKYTNKLEDKSGVVHLGATSNKDMTDDVFEKLARETIERWE